MARAARIAFLAPRFAEGATVGGAETLLRRLAERAAADGREVAFLTTCARDHYSWANAVPAGQRRVGSLNVHFFPVDEDRDIPTFLRVQNLICSGVRVGRADEEAWLRNSVNSRALYRHLETEGAGYDRIVAGPYLFGITGCAARIHPARTLLVPCLHDEAFARLAIMRELFHTVRGTMFNSEPERELAERLYGALTGHVSVVGMGLESHAESDPRAFARRQGLSAPYLAYAGRREPLKGTPILLDYLTLYRARTGRDVKLVLTGSGAIAPAPDLAPHVIDLGFVDEAVKHEAMAGAVAFCHPSGNESFGIVLMEAWLAGAPALVHAGGSVLPFHCRRSGGGLWFRCYPEFEAELTMLLDDTALRDRMGAAGRRYVRAEYSWEAVERRLFAALDAD